MRTVQSSQGMTISIGETATENEKLCKEARQNDLWFHLDGKSSPHAILSMPDGKAHNDNQLRDSIHEASQLVKHYSSTRDSAQAAVMFVEAKFVSKNGVGDSLGAVTLKKAPRKRSVVSDESTVTELLERIQRTKP